MKRGLNGRRYLQSSDSRTRGYQMKNRRKLLLGAIVLTLAIVSMRPCESKTGSAPKAEDDFQLVKVADGVYAAIAKSGGLASGNAGFVIGDDAVLVFDTFLTPPAIEELITVIHTLTKLPIKLHTTTHYH